MSAERSAANAEAEIAKAHKKMNSFSLFGGSSKYEEAAELFVKGANMYKVAKKWQEAGDAFIESARCHQKLQNKHEEATAYVQAATCYKKSQPIDAITNLQLAVEIYTDLGRFSSAAKHQKETAELYESEMELDNAIAAYERAADYYMGEDSTSAANSCLLKVAQFSAQLERYDRAVEIYEQVANTSLDNNLLKWSVKDYLMRAGLCILASGDITAAQRALEKYKGMDATFEGTRECKLLEDITAAVDANDVEQFTNVVFEFDSISKLDAWKTTIMLRVKTSIGAVDLT